MGLKAGLNFSDVNRARKLAEAGYNAKEIARDVKCEVEVIERRFFAGAGKADAAYEEPGNVPEVPDYVEPAPTKKKATKKK